MPQRAFLSLTMLCLLIAGCRVDSHKTGNGNDNVDIGTPFGSMHVKTDDSANGAQTGLTPYPGAVLVKKDGDDHGANEINFSFGSFKLGVHAVDMRTPDPADKVLAFYRHDMARYGAVLTCKGKTAVGTPVRTGDGLTCGTNGQGGSSDDSDHLELRAGSEQHQHIVGVHTEDGGTRIGLVALDLPGSLKHHDESERE